MARIFVEGWSPGVRRAPRPGRGARPRRGLGRRDRRADGVGARSTGVDDGGRADRVRRRRPAGGRAAHARRSGVGPVPGICGTFAVGAVRMGSARTPRPWSPRNASSDGRCSRAGGPRVFPAGRPRAALRARITTADRDDPAALLCARCTRAMRARRGRARRAARGRGLRHRRRAAERAGPRPAVGLRQEPPRHIPLPRTNSLCRRARRRGSARRCSPSRTSRRYSWYVRLATIPGGHAWSGIVRCEASAHAADRRRFARSPTAPRPCCRSSRPSRTLDPRAPQNLVPIGALERALRHRMGDPGLVYRRAPRGRRRAEGVVTDDRVGRVLGSEHSATAAFRVVVDDDEYLQLDDLVVVRTRGPEGRRGPHVRRRHRGRGRLRRRAYESDTHRIAELGIMPAAEGPHGAGRGDARRPRDLGLGRPRRGGRPRRPATSAPQGALRRRDGAAAPDRPRPRRRCPCTSTSTSSTVARAATCRSAGISGVATKTSFALFFLRVLTASPGVLGEGAANLRVLVFNVKGEDLLWLDRPNRLFDDEDAAEGWAALGVEPAPFPSVRFWAPPRRSAATRSCPTPAAGSRASTSFTWTPREFIDEDLLSSASPTRTTRATSSRSSASACSSSSGVGPSTWPACRAPSRSAIPRRRRTAAVAHGQVHRRAQAGAVITDLASLVAALEVFLEPDDGSEPDTAWTGRGAAGTVSAFLRRLHAAVGAARPPRPRRARAAGSTGRAASVTVVAIQSLHEQAQRFVVGALLNGDVPARRSRPVSGCRCR